MRRHPARSSHPAAPRGGRSGGDADPSIDLRRLYTIEARLRACYGRPHHHNPGDPLDDLVFVVLSRMTQETKYVRTYRGLRAALPTWGAVRDAPPDALRELLRDAGLAPTKARDIQAILREIEQREGGLDLGRLRTLDDTAVEVYLTSLPGVARKTARCVMLYALGRDVCPVDTHVWRVMRRLGYAPEQAWSELRARQLEERLPAGIRGSLHVTLVAHGRAACRARWPRCDTCVLADVCPGSLGT